MKKAETWLEKTLAYRFRDSELFTQALTHRSKGNRNNERLEFLGDAVLDFVVSDIVYRLRPDADEGDLSKLRAYLVKDTSLAAIAGELGLGEHLILGGGELKSGGNRRKSILADALEAIFGAVYLDSGFEAAGVVIETAFAERIRELPDSEDLKDAKTKLQEWLQARKMDLPDYQLVDVSGKDHKQTFRVTCTVAEDTTEGKASSRRMAEQAAAHSMITLLGDKNKMNYGDDYRCGFVAVIGRPNVGKSTFINAVMKRKVSIVTAKPQTTRHRILAVHTTSTEQIVFVDTPGLHRKAGKAMNRLMNRTAANALADADLILFVSDASYWSDEDDDVLRRLGSTETPKIALLNKIDNVRPKEALLAAIHAMTQRADFAEIVPMSALKGDNLNAVMKLLPGFLPESPPLFPENMLTDRGEEFHIAEIIREKLTLLLHQEMPYGLTVQVEQLKRDKAGVEISAVIWVERDSQKGIAVGKNGSVLKKAGRASRLEIAEFLGERVHLDLWVKVKSNWADNEKDLMSLGYESQ